MNIEHIQKNLNILSNWDDRFKYIIQLGKKLPPFPESKKTAEHKVVGCTSNVWLALKNNPKDLDDPLEFEAESDSTLVKGLIAILMSIVNQKTAKEILSTDIEKIFKDLGLDQHLSPSRTNGFLSMIKKIQLLAIKRCLPPS